MTNPQPAADDWLPRREVVKLLRVHKRTLNRWVGDGRLTERRGEQGRASYLASDVVRLVAERGAVNRTRAGEDGCDVDGSVDAGSAASAASRRTTANDGTVVGRNEMERIREALGGAEPTPKAIVAALQSWGADAAAWQQLQDGLASLEIEATVDGVLDALALAEDGKALLTDVEHGQALVLRGEQLQLYRTRVLEMIVGGDLVAVRVEQLRALGLLGRDDDKDHAQIVWRRLNCLREAQAQLQRLDALLRDAGLSEGVGELEVALAGARLPVPTGQTVAGTLEH
jgi:hypothetical protein